jgi:uncharacterized membrane protein YfcA
MRAGAFFVAVRRGRSALRGRCRREWPAASSPPCTAAAARSTPSISRAGSASRTGWARLALFSGTGLMFQPSLLNLAVVLLPCAVAGYFIGSHLHRRLAPRRAAQAIWILLLASGASLVWRALEVA